jgi:hypothetical protein
MVVGLYRVVVVGLYSVEVQVEVIVVGLKTVVVDGL